MALETTGDLIEEDQIFEDDYVLDFEDDLENDFVADTQATGTGILDGIGGFIENNYSLLFFFLLLVIIFNGTGSFTESNESLLFFFLILVIIFNKFY